jgi:phosphatidate phosphatase PAH1
MANTIDNTLKKIGNTIENIMGGTKPQQPSSNVSTSGKQTCLEKFGIEARKEHLYRNDWKIDLQYTKALVDAEYMIQNEFPVGSTDQSVQDQMEAARIKQEKQEAKAEAKRKAKEEKKFKKEVEKQKVINERNAPKEITERLQSVSDIMTDMMPKATRWG